MTATDLVAKVSAAATAVDAKLAADAAQIATLTANQNDPAVIQQVSDGLDAIIAKVS